MRKVLSLTLLLSLATLAGAQGKWHFNFGVGGELKSGNVNSITLNNSGGIERNDSLIALDANYAIVYGKQDQKVYDQSFTANLKFDFWQYDRWSPFVSATYLNNKFKGFEFQNKFLAGVKYRIYWNERCDYSVSAAYVFDMTEYMNQDDDRLKPQVSRLSLRLKIKQKISDYVSIKHTTFYQPSLMDLGGFQSVKDDYIVTSITSLSTKLSKHLTFDLSFNYEYRSLVPEGVQNQDIITTGTLKLNF